MASVDVCPVAELPPGHVKIIWSGPLAIGVYNCDGSYYAIEDRCSHDDGPLCEGEWEPDSASRSALATARASTSRPAVR